ncbi:hypothetical protein MACJ_002512 [Theileria orientalis]|uniref:Uncharacterized protein n=1 Tax=Theileria orientalis TaxID=68886 RepID=A0A976QVJ8_THEOR|nr:hypothetical protein MACJ_002512 [Theileria orientalis]
MDTRPQYLCLYDRVSKWNLIVLVRAAGYGTSATPELKLFKDDGSGNPVEMETSDFSQINYIGYLIYHFTPNVECTLVKFGVSEVWKKGDDSVEEPISVSYNSDEHKVVLFDDKKSVFYKKNNSGNWVHHLTIQRNEPPSTATSGSGEGEGSTVELGSLYPDSFESTVEIKASSSESVGGAEPAVTVELGSLYPDAGGSMVEVKAQSPLKVELGSLYPDSYGSTVDATLKSVPAEDASKGKVAGEGTTVELGSLYPDSYGSTVDATLKSVPAEDASKGKVAGEGTTVELGSLYPDSYGSTVDATLKSVPAEDASKGKVAGEGTTVELGSLYPCEGGSTVEVNAKSAAPPSEDEGKAAGEPAEGDGSSPTPPGSTNEPEAPTHPPENSSSPVNECSGTHTSGQSVDGSGTLPSNASEINPNEYPKDVKLYKADPNDANNTVEIDESDYTVKKDVDEYIYVFNTGVNCTLVKREDKDVWNYDSSKNNGHYPKEVGVKDDIVIVRINGASLIYEKKNEKWSYYETIQVK